MRNRVALKARAFSAFAVAVGCVGLSQAGAASITITPTYDSTVTSSPNSAAIQAGINAAIAQIQSKIQTSTATPLNVAITFQNISSGLGQSSQSIYGWSYSSYRSALAARATSANDATALANLPATSTFNGFTNMALTAPLTRSLGLANVADAATIGLNTSIMNLSRTGAQNSSFYDLQTVALHEIDEILGVGGPATTVGDSSLQSAYLGSLDVFRYKAPGTVSHSTGETAYLSINGGTTNIVTYNNSAGADYADYAANPTHYVQDAFGTPGTYRDLATPELTSYDVIGYQLASVPEPASIAVIGLGAAAFLRRRRAR